MNQTLNMSNKLDYLSRQFNRLLKKLNPKPLNQEVIEDYWSISRQKEGEVYASCNVGTVLEATHPIEAHYHTGGQNWMDTHCIEPGTKFIVDEAPTMHEFGGYQIIVLVDSTKALVDLCELHDKFIIVE